MFRINQCKIQREVLTLHGFRGTCEYQFGLTKLQRKVRGWKVYMEPYMTSCGQEVGLVQIMGDHDFEK
jgi:hypothetical protein